MNGIISKLFKKKNALARGNAKTMDHNRMILCEIAHQYFMSLPHSYFLPRERKDG